MANPRTRPHVATRHADESEHRRLLADRVNAALMGDGSNAMSQPLQLAHFAAAQLPAASLWEGALVYVPDESGGAVPAYSDGTDWRRVTDRAVVG